MWLWNVGIVQIEGNNANADDAIMLDKDGYVSETNATNIVSFLHQRGQRICFLVMILMIITF